MRAESLARAALLVCALAACDRETRDFRPEQPARAARTGTAEKPAAVPVRTATVIPDYGVNAYAMAEGKRLFVQFNCSGCHAYGGGGMGPPLMDAAWIYGAEPTDIYASIARGRPNGMPAFGASLNRDQTWQLVFYVRSMSGLGRMDARPGRSDRMSVREPEVMTQPASPRPTRTP